MSSTAARVPSRRPRPSQPAPKTTAKSAPKLRLVPRRVSTARAPFLVVVGLVLGLGVAGLLAFNTAMQQASFQIRDLELQARALAAKEQKLSLELDRLRDPQHVAEAARKRGMVPPPSPAFVDLATGRILGNPQPATPQDAMRVTPRAAAKPRNLDPEPRVVVLSREEAAALAKVRKARKHLREARRQERAAAR